MVSIPHRFRRFATETKLHGIPRILADSKLSMAFWTLLVILSFCMASKDLNELINYYHSEPTAIQMSLINENVTWPTPTLCMEFNVMFIDNVSATNNFVASVHDVFVLDWKKATLGLDSNSFYNFYKLAETDFYTNATYQDARADPTITYFDYMLIGYLNELEQKLLKLDHPYLKGYQFGLTYNDPLVQTHTHRFYEAYKIITPTVSMTNLSKVIGMWYCLRQLVGILGIRPTAHPPIPGIYEDFENYRYFGDPNYIALPICKASMITYLGFSMVCSKLFETATVPFVPGYNYFSIYDTHMTQFDDTNPDFGGYAKLIPNFKWHLDIEGRDVMPLDSTNVFSWNPSEHISLDISVASEYQYLNRKIKPCSSAEETQYQCKRRKQLAYVYEQCGCWPSLADHSSPTDVVYCSDYSFLDQYITAQQQVYNLTTTMLPCGNSLDQLDTSDCLPDCHRIKNKFTRQLPRKLYNSRTWSQSNVTDNVGSLEFRYTSDPHNFIEEIAAVQQSNFLGTWGGSIGTWLGASLLAFLHIAIFLARQYVFKDQAAASA